MQTSTGQVTLRICPLSLIVVKVRFFGSMDMRKNRGAICCDQKGTETYTSKNISFVINFFPTMRQPSKRPHHSNYSTGEYYFGKT